MPNNTAIYLYIAVSLIAIGLLSGFLVNRNNNKCQSYSYLADSAPYPNDPHHRDMCLCSGGGKKLCANKQQLLASYEQGNTEYQDFSSKQTAIGGPYWHSTDFNLY